ncbi:hypothetical protein J7I98_22165 [Streptomyces sp. ISL-98]|uniref:hypothetical protein n=1 Tax=Streptomyces sp. ISL-98 TaxID=2819192 RepID=UPI001BE65E57|nr:hypothetical protein [Streptomyces sp. ISL-98]MBT2508544.1 hypothetical protein [Streptomyces sp. ISL-98]
MAAIKDIVKKFTGSEEQKKDLKFTLGILDKLAAAKTDAFKERMKELPEASLGPVRVKADPYWFEARSYVKVSDVPNTMVSGVIDKGLRNSDPDFKSIIADVLQGSLDILLGHVSAGEYKEERQMVTLDENSIIRVDSFVWQYQFDYNGLTSGVNNVFAYGLSLSTVKLDCITEELLRLQIQHMVGAIPNLDPQKREQKEQELFEKLHKKADYFYSAAEKKD